MLPTQQTIEPALGALPGHWLRLDATGHVLSADAALLARLDLARRGPGIDFQSWLAPASQAMWATSLWPTLLATNRLAEALLDLDLPPSPDAVGDGCNWPMLSSWRAETGDGPPSYIGLLTPGRERQRLVAELRLARDSLDAMPGAVLQVSSEPGGGLAFPYASNRLLDLFGVTPAQAQASPDRLMSALTPASREALQTSVAQALAEAKSHWLVVLVPRQGPPRQLELAARRSAHPSLWHGVITDVSERESLQQELRQRAETDALTHLPNRGALLAQLRQRLAAGQPFALLFMDCDRFKQINDSLGHEAGDEVLRHMAQRLRHGLRPADALISLDTQGEETLAARLGGDEFVVIADGVTDAAGVAAIADRLVRVMAQPYKLRGLELMAPVSVGVMLATPDSVADQMLRDADTAMYEAKRRGRGSWVLFEPEMHARVSSALAMESDLRQALREGQLRAAFQPIVDIASGRVVGLEALARWHHPLRGEVPPAQFIPVAEESGLIGELGETMLRLACTAFASWQRAGMLASARVSVNLSRSQLTDRQLPARIRALLAEVDLPCSSLQLEVTESMAMDNVSGRTVLDELHALGVRLALDDFGTGHSSLASLQQFPVQQVKIDRAFVQDIETSVYHRALVQAALQVTQALGLEVVAEGVETATQARLLAELGCARAQGWLYARALEADAVPDFLSSALPRHLDVRLQGLAAVAAVSRAHNVIVTDAQGLTLHVNAAFTLNTGYTLDDLRGRTPGAVLQGPETDPRAVRALHDAVAKGTGCLGVEIVNYRKDGRPFHVLIDIEPVRDDAGRIVQFASLQTEISARKQGEREPSQLQLLIQDVQSVGLVGFWEHHLVTGAAQGDPHTRRLLGLRPDDTVPAFGDLSQRATPETRAALEDCFNEVRRGVAGGLVRFSMQRAEGGVRDLQAHWSRQGDRLLGVLVDVSGPSRRQAE